MMMDIRHIPAGRINREEWDGWVTASANRRVYACSVFLDIFAPGWGALVMGSGDAIMPLTVNRKWGISYLFQPVFVQQLGILMKDAGVDYTDQFLERVSSTYRFSDIALNEMNHPDAARYQCVNMTNYLLKLDLPYDQLVKGYDTNTLRNIRKADRLGVDLRPHEHVNEVVRLFELNGRKLYPNIRNINYSRLEAVLERGLSDGFIEMRGAFSPGGELIAALCMLADYDRYVFFFSANTAEGRNTGAMFLLVDSFIQQYAGSGRTFDFNGSVNPGLARFYKGFGSKAAMYSRIRISRLPFPVSLLKG